MSFEQLITEHLDIWTAADTEKKSGRGRSSGSASNVYGVKKLRELILELAVRGKLVPQDASDEPASELLKRIATEKAKLVAEGKIKKSKPLAEITDDEKLFELPSTWKWLRLPDIYYSLSVSKNKLLSSEIKETGLYPVVDQGQRFIAGYTDNEDLLIYLSGPVVVFGDHTTERKLIDFDFVAGADGVKILRPILQSERFFWLQLKGLKLEGRGYARHFKILNECFYALPPINEQHRIVAKVDELMALCDQLENQHNNAAEAHEKLVTHLLVTLTQSQNAEDFNTHWQRISEHFDTLFTTEASIDALKQTLLQLAVMGKLVPQDPNDEPASELLKRIQAEKAKLIVEGKIKKDKPLAEITEEEKPFELPVNWKWIKLGVLVNTSDSGWSPSCEAFPRVGSDWGILKVSAVSWGKFLPNENKSLPKSLNARLDCEVKTGDFLISRANTADLVAKSVVIEDCPPNLMLSDKIVRLRLTSFCNSKFINLVNSSSFARSYYSLIAGGTSSSMKNVTREQILNLIIPLPPLAEHQRIFEKVEELMTICDKLKSQITSANQLQQKLADVMTQGADC